jgi:hypothetical protein
MFCVPRPTLQRLFQTMSLNPAFSVGGIRNDCEPKRGAQIGVASPPSKKQIVRGVQEDFEIFGC